MDEVSSAYPTRSWVAEGYRGQIGRERWRRVGGAITDSANTMTTSQLASEYNSSASKFSRVLLSTDGIFGNELATITYDVRTRDIILLTVRIDTNIKATAKSVSGNAGTHPYHPNLAGWHALIIIAANLLVFRTASFLPSPATSASK